MRPLIATALVLTIGSTAAHAKADDPAVDHQKLVTDDDDNDVRFRIGQRGSLNLSNGFMQANVDTTAYSDICEAPCQSFLKPGAYHLSLAKGDDSAPKGEDVYIPSGQSTIKGTYTSNSTLRTLGWGLIGGGGVVGSALIFVGAEHKDTVCFGSVCAQGYHADGGMMAAGTIVGIASIVTGFLLTQRLDEAHFEILGADVSVLPTFSLQSGREGQLTPAIQGVALAATW